MAHNGNPGPHTSFDSSGNFRPAFHFHTFAQTFPHDTAHIAHGFIDAAMIGEKRHIRNDKRNLGAAGDGLGMMNHIIQRHRKGGIITQHHVSQ
ncbi:hypothetical protein D3C75_1149080 [compost metagenome]